MQAVTQRRRASPLSNPKYVASPVVRFCPLVALSLSEWWLVHIDAGSWCAGGSFVVGANCATAFWRRSRLVLAVRLIAK